MFLHLIRSTPSTSSPFHFNSQHISFHITAHFIHHLVYFVVEHGSIHVIAIQFMIIHPVGVLLCSLHFHQDFEKIQSCNFSALSIVSVDWWWKLESRNEREMECDETTWNVWLKFFLMCWTSSGVLLQLVRTVTVNSCRCWCSK